MGKLVEQTLRTLYQGVSRQPDTVRLPGQVEEATNAMFSVVSGGFSKRPGTHLHAKTSLVDAPTALYGYERDANESYLILIQNGTLYVYNNTGSQVTVTVESGASYLSANDSSQDFAFTTVADYTFIANKTVSVAMSTDGVFDSSTMPHILVRNADGTFTFKESSDYTERPAIDPDYYVNPNITYSLTNDAGGRFKIDADTGVVRVKDATLVNAATDTTYDIEVTATSVDGTSNTHTFTIYAYASSVGELIDDDTSLDSTDVNGMVFENASEGDLVGLTVFAEDRIKNAEPIIEKVPEDLIPTPDFVGQKLSDITFFRNRLGFVADETVYFSQASDYMNFWPKTVAQVIDSDAFGRTASSSQVNLLRYVVPFRKALFCSADTAQFELSADQALTPTATTIGLSTQYATESLCRPMGFRDELYFASRNGSNAVLFEYYYSDTSVGHTANDVLIHAAGYIPSPLVSLSGDTVTGTIFALSDADRSCIYVYRTFWSGEEKAQSAWSRWEFGQDSIIMGKAVIRGELFLVIKRNNEVLLERLPLNADQVPTNASMPIRLDTLQLLTGTYDSTTGLTTYVGTSELSDDIAAILDSNSTPLARRGAVLSITSVSGNSFTVQGDYSDSPAFVGSNYNMVVEMSKQYLREGESETTVTTGRLQLKRMYFDYRASAHLEVVVTPKYRESKVYTFNGSSSGGSFSSTPVLQDGTFAVPIRSDGSTVNIQIQNPTYLPCTVTSAKWKGFFNETTRQE